MTVTTESTPSAESVDTFAQQLYQRARYAGASFVDLAIAVRNLHTPLKHLDAEARDPESALHQPDPTSSENRNSVYARQLRSLVEGTDFTLKQVGTVLERYGDSGGIGVVRRDLDPAERSRKIDLVRRDVVSQSMKISAFLDTVQPHNPAKSLRVLENADDRQLDMIRNKVDAIANRLFRERKDQSPVEVDEDELWRNFKAELEREGFPPEMLRKNKEVLRAYIRELESRQLPGGVTPPSVRGLLAWDAQSSMAAGNTESRPSLEGGPLSNEGRRRAPTPGKPDPLPLCPQPCSPVIPTLPPHLSFEQYTSSESSDTEGGPLSHTALISTRDLMALDRDLAGKVTDVSGFSLLSPMRVPFHIVSPGTSPSSRYLPPGAQPLPIPGSVSSSHDAQFTAFPPAYSNRLSPGSPPPPYDNSLTVPGAAWDLSTLPASAPAASNDMLQHQPAIRQYSQLAPDSKGQTIPLHATWTKINRKLVSPEVLERAGVRYEARPNFVAVLGILTREQIEEYTRQSFEVRNVRGSQPARAGNTEDSGFARSRETYGDHGRRRRGKDSAKDGGSGGLFDASESGSSDDDGDRCRGSRRDRGRGRYTPKDYNSRRNRHLDSEDDEKGTKVYPVIVSPPASISGDSISPSSTVGPKPILKNRNPNHVRFNSTGPREISPGRYSGRGRRGRDREAHREGSWERERDRDRDRHRRDKSTEKSRERARDKSRDRSRDRSGDRSRDRSRDRDRDRERDRDRNRDRETDYRSSRRHQDRDRDQRGRAEEERPPRRSAFKDAAGAIGVSSAAATLLSVLTQAVQHL